MNTRDYFKMQSINFCYMSFMLEATNQKTVYINGEAISFRSSYWSSLITDGSTGRYVSGTLSYMPERDMDVKVVFARNTYKMTVDASSVNGSTTLSVTKNDESGDGATEVSGRTLGYMR